MVFISHSAKDMTIAMAVVAGLERRGITCWIASRDIAPGDNYQEAIDTAIRSACAMLLILSAHAVTSSEVKKELSLASSYGVTVIPARAEAITPTGAFKYELSITQWIDVFGDLDHALDRLAERIGRPRGATLPAAAMPVPWPGRRFVLAGGAMAGAAGAIGAVLLARRRPLALRNAPAPLSGAQVEAMLVKRDFYDSQHNPGGHGPTHRYRQQAIGDAVVVIDGATGLMWQKTGSRFGMPLAVTPAFIHDLNAGRYAGFADWRLPTLEEAASLLEPVATEDYHVASHFQGSCPFIWTADRPMDAQRGYVVYYADGFITSESRDLNAYVCAVRSLSP